MLVMALARSWLDREFRRSSARAAQVSLPINTHEFPNRLPSSSTSLHSNHHTSPQLPIHELESSITEIQITSSLTK